LKNIAAFQIARKAKVSTQFDKLEKEETAKVECTRAKEMNLA